MYNIDGCIRNTFLALLSISLSVARKEVPALDYLFTEDRYIKGGHVMYIYDLYVQEICNIYQF
jgi:hypothetical protein